MNEFDEVVLHCVRVFDEILVSTQKRIICNNLNDPISVVIDYTFDVSFFNVKKYRKTGKKYKIMKDIRHFSVDSVPECLSEILGEPRWNYPKCFVNIIGFCNQYYLDTSNPCVFGFNRKNDMIIIGENDKLFIFLNKPLNVDSFGGFRWITADDPELYKKIERSLAGG